MKNAILLLSLFTLLSCTSEQNKNIDLSKSPFPSLNILLIDSTTIFNTKNIHEGSPIIIMYFSPDCEHCQEQTKNLLKNMKSLGQAQIYLITPMPFSELKDFYNAYHLADYKNVIVGKDYEYSFYKLFKPTGFPLTVIYNGDKKMVKLYKGKVRIDKIFKAMRA